MIKSNSTSKKEKTNSASNGSSKNTVRRDSATEKFINENGISKADELTLRAWKKTFENRKKAA